MVSLKQIAADLDVSYTLVSKVLSGRLGTTGVSERTREAILKKAKELDYIPNSVAVALKAGRKGAVGIFFHHIGTPGSDVSDRLLRSIAEGLEKSGSRMWLRFFTTDEGFLAACDMSLKGVVDGLIVAGVPHPGLKERLSELERHKVPVVALFSDEPMADGPYGVTTVRVNYESHGFMATTHLLEQGCRSLASFCTTERRTEGFIRAHQQAGVEHDPRLMIQSQGYFPEHGQESLEKLLKLQLPFDGIVCQSDTQASGAINELIRRGIKVPEAVKVTGVDNSPAAENCIVPITSMTSEMRRAGLKVVKLLMQKIEGKAVKSVVIEPALRIRSSSRAS